MKHCFLHQFPSGATWLNAEGSRCSHAHPPDVICPQRPRGSPPRVQEEANRGACRDPSHCLDLKDSWVLLNSSMLFIIERHQIHCWLQSEHTGPACTTEVSRIKSKTHPHKPGQQRPGTVLIKQERENLKTKHSLVGVWVEAEPVTWGLFSTAVDLAGGRGEREAGQSVTSWVCRVQRGSRFWLGSVGASGSGNQIAKDQSVCNTL
jgi:hypothetical protein